MKTIYAAEVKSMRAAVSHPKTRRREFREDFFE
jgi:hypothetical protein